MLIPKQKKLNNSLAAKMFNTTECNVRQLEQQKMNYKMHIVHEMFFEA